MFDKPLPFVAARDQYRPIRIAAYLQLIDVVKQGHLGHCLPSRALFDSIAKQSPTLFTFILIFKVSAQIQSVFDLQFSQFTRF